MTTPRAPSPAENARAPVDFWPDLDVYFKRDIALAIAMVAKLQAFGVRTIKAAALHDADCCLASDATTQYHVAGRGQVTESYRSIIERHVVPLDDLRRICGAVRDRGLDLVLSVYDLPGIALAREFGAVAIKIPSSNIVHAPLIRAAAATGLRLVLDTGKSRLAEIDRAVEWARAAGAADLLVQHSPPGPPAPAHAAQLAALPMLKARYGVPVGLSDHHAGIDLLPLAVALGAAVLEKGVCADDAAPDIDLAHALPISKVPRALEAIRLASDAVGSGSLEARETLAAPADRMGLVAARDLQAGERIGTATVRFAFPAAGIPVEQWDEVAGRALVRPLSKGEPVPPSALAPA
jgi:sialic acid synthase SpsE